jgi:predicted RNase H-like HicB family nuclease
MSSERTSGTIYVQRDPADSTWDASIAELPGAFAHGATREEAVSRVKRAFHAYLELLEARGVSIDHWRSLDPETFAVREPEDRFIYPEDFDRPLEEHEIRDFLHRMEATRSALLSLVRGLSPEQLEQRPTETSWSVREALEHVMFTEVGLLSKLERWPEREFATLQAVHRMAFQRFTVMEPGDAIDHTILGRRWSTRRVMRRILEHEFQHIDHITEIISALGGDRAPE